MSKRSRESLSEELMKRRQEVRDLREDVDALYDRLDDVNDRLERWKRYAKLLEKEVEDGE